MTKNDDASEHCHVKAMANLDSRVTIHMAASLDGFIARKDGRVDWLETSDEFIDGDSLDAGDVETFLKTIDCYVMGSRTYETALNFEAKGLGWSYGDKPTFVLTTRALPRTRDTVEFYSGDLSQFVNERLRPAFRSYLVCGRWDRLRRMCSSRSGRRDSLFDPAHLDRRRSTIFEKLGRDVILHLAEVKVYNSGIVELRYDVRGSRGKSQDGDGELWAGE